MPYIQKEEKEHELNYNLNTTHFSEQHIKFYFSVLTTQCKVNIKMVTLVNCRGEANMPA